MNQSVEYLGDQVCVCVGIRVRVVVGQVSNSMHIREERIYSSSCITFLEEDIFASPRGGNW